MDDLQFEPGLEPVVQPKKSDLDAAREAFAHAWRPAGSMSLAERWLRAGETDEPRRALPPRPPAPPAALKLKLRRIKK